MFAARVVDWEGKLASNCDEAPGDDSARDGAWIPSVQEEEETFKGNSNGITLVAHDGKAFVEIPA
jgi:hypothetical protein